MTARLDYWRADNMWAAMGRPDGPLGKESISLQVGQQRVFVTDWRYEKSRNDGTNFYGSHGRILQNVGTIPIDVVLKGVLDTGMFSPLILKVASNVAEKFGVSNLGNIVQKTVGGRIRLKPGAKVSIRNDIAEVLVPRL